MKLLDQSICKLLIEKDINKLPFKEFYQFTHKRCMRRLTVSNGGNPNLFQIFVE